MWRGIVFHVEGPATAKALSPFCVLVGGTTRRVLSDASFPFTHTNPYIPFKFQPPPHTQKKINKFT